ncbi:MAG: hypothetical protein DME83_04815 [Verrucomicrobia bacterium]|nr:MAG: hypothetical protein DME83_04815 [Verrucomicrobiota bacterium]
MKNTIAVLAVINILAAASLPAKQSTSGDSGNVTDPGWPREKYSNGNRLIIYQPQVDDWKNFQELTWRMAVSLTPKGGKEVVGVVEMKGNTDVDNVAKVVIITNPQVTGTHFPSLDQATAEKMEQSFKTFIPPTLSISLHRLIASLPMQQAPAGVQLNNDPPKIFVGYRPSILLSVDGEPALSEVPKTNLKFVVNTQWPLFFDNQSSSYYLAVGQQWLTTNSLEGQWSPAKKLPPDMSKVPQDKQWSALKKIIPPPAKSGGVTPAVFYSDKPAEVILFDGQPVYAQVQDTQLTYATNTDSVVFVFTPTQQFYYLTAGRWFSAMDLQGPWTYATPNLPADFAKIPPSSPASAILASVPGTDEAKDAVLLAQVPTTMTVKPAEAQAKVKVAYGGDPKFEPIKGTSMAYATNTQDKVIKVGDVYYLCLQGVWFMSPNPQGPWTTCTSVPQEIYTIPPSSPVYNVTYVTQSTNPDGTVQASYTAGYLGAFVLGAATGAIIASGSGYWWPPYAYGGYYYPYAATYCGGYYYGGYGYHYATPYYNSATGAYGWKQTAYGPYGSATRGAAYNPYTGTYARGSSVSTPYGSRSAAQAYNPYTGTYAQTRQGSSPNAQWGSSYVSRGNQSATMGHYSTANGTVAGISGSQGGKAVGASTAWGNTAAGKTASGNMYAGHDGNVYKNTGNGWQKYDNGSWNSVSQSKPYWQQAESSQQRTATESNQQRTSAASNYDRSSASGASYNRSSTSSYNRASEGGYNRSGGSSSSEMQNMQREAQNRQRGGQESQRFQDCQRSGGGDRWGGGGGGWGGRSGGGGRGRR